MEDIKEKTMTTPNLSVQKLASQVIASSIERSSNVSLSSTMCTQFANFRFAGQSGFCRFVFEIYLKLFINSINLISPMRCGLSCLRTIIFNYFEHGRQKILTYTEKKFFDQEKFGVCDAISRNQNVGPLFFDNTVNCSSYKDIVMQFDILLELLERWCSFQHTAHAVGRKLF